MNIIKKENLTISLVLFEFINTEVIPGTGIDVDRFWEKFDSAVHELAPINRMLIEKREAIQKK
jgi:malate synthase